MLFVFFSIPISPALGVSHQKIFEWVGIQLDVNPDYPMPEIRFVSKEEIQNIFKSNTRKSYQRWAEELGKKEANRILDFYLKEVIGLFDPETQNIYPIVA